jgi:hypothetical protein
MKIAYAILNTPKDFRQDHNKKPTAKQIKSWMADRVGAQ